MVGISAATIAYHTGRPSDSRRWRTRRSHLLLTPQPPGVLSSRRRRRMEGRDRDRRHRRRAMPLRRERPYFICPGVVNGTACGWRVSKLYGPGRYFLCRHCYRLVYASQSQNELGRLGGGRTRPPSPRRRSGTASHPPRPKGMWRRIYERLCGKPSERADDGKGLVEP